ncbi:hypothetical protein [Legionella gresilensis]|uniref:hypothetical protein n=1 Tax=Legionella gresilensis TaxID=91823 RepID=UPI001040F6A8|nr:hypothetical protein [Legionella gresilensis]
MLNNSWKKFFIFLVGMFFSIQFPSVVYAEDSYRSQFINQSNEGAVKYVLVKTRVWPESGCVVDSGQEILLPGDKTQLIILKKQGCEEAGIGYSFYKSEDTKRESLLGYVSHRFRDGKFSLQISMFCESGQCVFRDLNPDQTIKK